MMHQDSLEPAAIRFTLEHLQESARSQYKAVKYSYLNLCDKSGKVVRSLVLNFTLKIE